MTKKTKGIKKIPLPRVETPEVLEYEKALKKGMTKKNIEEEILEEFEQLLIIKEVYPKESISVMDWLKKSLSRHRQHILEEAKEKIKEIIIHIEFGDSEEVSLKNYHKQVLELIKKMKNEK